MQPTGDAGTSLQLEVDEVEAETDNSLPYYSSKLSGQTMYHAVSNNGENLYAIYLHYLINSFCKQCATNSYSLAYDVNYTFKVFLLQYYQYIFIAQYIYIYIYIYKNTQVRCGIQLYAY